MPQRLEDVYVVGAVQKPGAYPFIPDFTALDYVGLAGSTENAGGISRTKVVRRDSHNKLDAKAPVEAGDIVFVPRRVEFGIREITSIVAAITNILVMGKVLKIF